MEGSLNSLHFIGQKGWEVPDPRSTTNSEGLIALSWDLSLNFTTDVTLKEFFPWFEQEGVVFWFSPSERSITPTEKVKISRSMRPLINARKWRFSSKYCF